MDSGSYTFRYATMNNGSPSLPAELRHIGLANFRRVLLGIANVLETFDTAIGSEMDAKAEYSAYLAGEQLAYTRDWI